MKKVTTAFLAIALSVPALAVAQSNAQQDDKNAQAQQNQAAETNQMGSSTMPQKTMSGMVGDNGKTLTSDNKTYMVNNPKALKNYNNQTVAAVIQFDTDNNKIHIVSVTAAQP